VTTIATPSLFACTSRKIVCFDSSNSSCVGAERFSSTVTAISRAEPMRTRTLPQMLSTTRRGAAPVTGKLCDHVF
jgi:hypothetical protein